jgi:hypothetical protein
VTNSEVRIEVFDRNPTGPVLQHPDWHSEGGRGLLLVDALADAWGCELVAAPSLEHPAGKWVWFVLNLSTPPHPRDALPARTPIVPDEVIPAPRAEPPTRPNPRPVRPQPAIPRGEPDAVALLPRRVRQPTTYDPDAAAIPTTDATSFEVMERLHAVLRTRGAKVAAQL